MTLKATWLGRDDVERIADVRLRCYGNGPADRPTFLRRTEIDPFENGDVLMLSDATGDVATATSLSLSINVRGTALPCQGVAWVGTVRSHRRRKIDGRGLASRVMDALIAKARERTQAVSLLAPFRVSFYESFGYGVVERQHTWTIPLSTLPQADADAPADGGVDGIAAGFAQYQNTDFDAALSNRDRQFQQTHGDVATDAARLKHWLAALDGQGFRFVDRQDDRVTAQFTLGTEIVDGEQIAVVHRPYWDSPAALKRLLVMLGTLRDQYAAARITLPTDVPINWWLRERQVPHRRVDHPAARCQLVTRMQAKILDVPTYVAALRPGDGANGDLHLQIDDATYRIDVQAGHATAVASSGPADLATAAPSAAAMLFGDLKPPVAQAMQRVETNRPSALALFDRLVASGPPPYCHEYF